MIALTARPDGVVVPVRAQPGARKDAILGARAGALRVAVSAPPEKGRANEAVRDVLAAAIGCRASRVRLLAGASSREKLFLVESISLDDLRDRLARATPAD